MQLRVLGPLRGEAGGRVVGPAGQRPRDVLAVLAMRHPRPVRAEVLRDLVWDGAARSDAVVHTVVARLRQQLGHEFISRSAQGYSLGPAVILDAVEFAQSVRAGQATGTRSSWREQEVSLRAALAWWSGQAYAGVSDSLVYLERTRLDELRAAARFGLVEALVEQGTRAGAEESWEETRMLLADNPMDERVALLAMRAALQLQRQAAALEIFDRLRRALRTELGISPGPHIMAEHDQILQQGAAAAPVAPPPPATPPAAPPVPLTRTVGREGDLHRIEIALARGARLVTLVGTGGVGKSRVLAEVAASAATNTAYVPLGAIGEGDTVAIVRAIATATGVRVAGPHAALGLREALRSTSLTLLLDEAEWAVRAVAECVTELLGACPGLRVVVTSRRPLGVIGEHLIPIDPLALPASAAADDLVASPAAGLLISRLGDRAVRPVAHLSAWTREDLAAVHRIVCLTDGLPLAIELVAGQAGAGGLATLARDPVGILDAPASQPGGDPRHRTLRDTLTSSLDRLHPDDRTALRRLAVLVGSFNEATARAVIGAMPSGRSPDTALRSLAADNLVHVERGTRGLSLRLLRPVRELAWAELDPLDAARTVKRRRDWFAARWRGVPLCDDLISDVAATQDDHVVSLEDAIQDGDADSAADLVIALARLWLLRESIAVPLPWIDAVLALPGLSSANRARLLVTRSALRHGEDWDAHDVLTALAADADWTVHALALDAIRAYLRGDLGLAIAVEERALRLAEQAARSHVPEALATLAAFHAAAGELVQARHRATQALALVDASRSFVQSSSVLPKVALALLDLGELEEALRLLDEASRLSMEHLGLPPTSTLAINAGWAALGCGRVDEAHRWFRSALEPPGASGVASLVGEALAGVGCVLARAGDLRAGEALAAAAAVRAHADITLTPMMQALVEAAVASLPGGLPEAPERDIDLTLDIALGRGVGARAAF